MCLGIPSRVVSIEGTEAEIEVGGVRRRTSITLTPEVRVGEYVVVHAGYAISVLDQGEAQETLQILNRLGLET